MPIDPTTSALGLVPGSPAAAPRAADGAEWRIDGIAPTEAPAGSGGGFGDMLGSALQSLATTQTEAAEAAQALATGQAEDPTAVVMAVERAQLSMQLASQIRTKAVEAAQDIFHTQV
jgi:flagellar hook-basal body complex protein FliE